jgi:hypothetical protein
MKSNRLLIIVVLFIFISSCNSKRHPTVGGSSDTSSVNNGGGPPIADTSTVSANEKNNPKGTAKDTSKGNADPSGSYGKSNAKKP